MKHWRVRQVSRCPDRCESLLDVPLLELVFLPESQHIDHDRCQPHREVRECPTNLIRRVHLARRSLTVEIPWIKALAALRSCGRIVDTISDQCFGSSELSITRPSRALICTSTYFMNSSQACNKIPSVTFESEISAKFDIACSCKANRISDR